MDIIEIYESASTDGYSMFGDKKYFYKKCDADEYSKLKHGKFFGRSLLRRGLSTGSEDEFYLFKEDPVIIVIENTKAMDEKLKEIVLSKLTDKEKELLGLI